jgi:polar amino acid transport system permease protein
MSDHLEFVWEQLPNLLWGYPSRRPGGLLLTILLSAGAIGVGLVLAVGLAAASHSRVRIVRLCSSTITRVVRGIPLIVLLVLLFQVLAIGALLGIEFSAFWAAAVTLTLYSAASRLLVRLMPSP